MRSKHRTFVMLAKYFEEAEPKDLSNWLWSKKYDGHRALWIPHLRGTRPDFMRSDVPATGLFTRYARVYRAPDYFLDDLPTDRCLDGELVAGTLEETASVVKSHNADWTGTHFHVFDSPTIQRVLERGQVRNPLYEHFFKGTDLYDPFLKFYELDFHGKYHSTVAQNPITDVEEHFQSVIDAGGEGIMLRSKFASWRPTRSKLLLKRKQIHLGEGVITGYNPGKNALVGEIGSVQVNNLFKVSGFNARERELIPYDHPIGASIKYEHSDWTAAGVPRNARFRRDS